MANVPEGFVQECAFRLESLANDARFVPRGHELQQLAAELRTPDADSWAGTDLFSAFRPDDTVVLRHRNLGELTVGALAGISVFLPVAWTWFGFRSASSAYEDLISRSGEPEGRTFLGLWASGFDGRLDGWHRLVPMATGSLALIFFAIFCLVVHRLIANHNIRREDELARAAGLELATALTSAQRILNARRADHPQRIEGIIKSSLQKLRQAQEATLAAVTMLSSTADKVGEGTDKLLGTVNQARSETEALLAKSRETSEQLGVNAVQSNEAMASSIKALEAAVSSGISATNASVSEGVRATTSAVDESIKASSAAVVNSTGELSRALASALASFESELSAKVGELRNETVGAISTAGSSLVNVVDTIGTSAERTAQAADTLRLEVGAMSDSQEASRADLARSLEDIRMTLDGFELALARHESALQGQASELTGTRDAAERMLRHLNGSVAAQQSGDITASN